MKKVNSFVRGNLTKIYLGFMLLFWILIMVSCEKEPIEPFQLPTAVDPTEISGQWNITKFYMLLVNFENAFYNYLVSFLFGGLFVSLIYFIVKTIMNVRFVPLPEGKVAY